MKSRLLFFSLWILVFLARAGEQSFSSNLPLIFINTNGQPVPDDPKIAAHMGVIWNVDQKVNHTTGEFNHYDGKIGIELRGSTSQSFPKKSYGIETWDENGEDVDFPLLGFPEEEDWILYGPYSDKTLIRNVLTFTLAKAFHAYSPRCKFVELFLNGKYEGVYVFMEKIKVESTRVDIARLNPEDNSGNALTGGYIIKIDKTTGSGGAGWHSTYNNPDGLPDYYQYEVPADDEISSRQKDYIRGYVDDFEDAVFNRNFSGKGSTRDLIDYQSFIDYTLISELTKNVDAYRLSTFFYKDRGGKLHAGPVWDYNLAYGNVYYDNGWSVAGFQLKNEAGYNPFWWEGLWEDEVYLNYMKCRWNALREEAWSDVRIFEVVDSLVATLGEAVARNFARWPVLGAELWPNYYVGADYTSEVFWLKGWLGDRLAWLDQHLPGLCTEPFPPPVIGLEIDIFPNPFNSGFTLSFFARENFPVRFQLYSLSGSCVADMEIDLEMGRQEIKINTDAMDQGQYFYLLFKDNIPFKSGKLLKIR